MPTIPAAGYSYRPYPTETPGLSAGTPYQQLRPSADAFGAGVGQALVGLGQTIGRGADAMANIALQRQALFNEIAADDQARQAEDQINKLIYGDPDVPGDTGFKGKRGRLALDEFPKIRRQIEDVIRGSRDNLQNLQQQKRFDDSTSRFKNYVLSETGRHYDREFHSYAQDAAKARLELNMGGIANAASEGNFAGFKSFLGRAHLQLEEDAKRTGEAPEVTAAKRQEVTKRSAKEWAESLAVRDPLAAQQFIENNKDVLQDIYPDLAGRVKAKALQQQALEIVTGTSKPRSTDLVRGGAVAENVGRVRAEAEQIGIDPELAVTTFGIESNFGQAADRPGSQYKGPFQMGNEERASMGGGDIEHGVRLLAQRKQELARRIGREPENWEVYLAHQQGVAGASRLLENPNTPAGQLVPPRHISANNGNPNAPASAFISYIRNTYERRKAQGQQFVTGVSDETKEKLLTELPPREDGQLPDDQVPGLMKRLEEMAKRMPKDAPPDLWWSAVKLARQMHNMQYTDMMNAERIRSVQQKKRDDELMNQFITRMAPDSPAFPTAQEILAHPELSGDAKRILNAFLTRELMPGPDTRTAANNEAELFRRIHLPDDSPEKIRDERVINEAFAVQRLLTRDGRERLIKDFREANNQATSLIEKRKADLLKAVQPRIRPMLSMQNGEMLEAYSDRDGPQRELRYKLYVDEQITAARKANKNPMDLFDPDKPDYLGKPERVEQFAKGAPDLTTRIADPQQLSEPKNLAELQAAWKAGRYGPYGSAEAKEKAAAEAVRLKFVRPPEPQVPVR